MKEPEKTTTAKATKAKKTTKTTVAKTTKTTSSASAMKIAVADIQAIVMRSAQVMALKEEQALKSRELGAWLQKAQNEVKTQADKAKQEALLKQYNAEFAQRRLQIIRNYQEKLKIVSANISKTIADEAQKKGFDMVLARNTVVFGGVDITADIAKIIK